MVKVIIASHHRLAKGMKDTLDYLVPGLENIKVITAYLDNTPIDESIDHILEGISKEESILIFTDLLGGSVNQAFGRRLKEKMYLIAGMNLPLIMTILLQIQTQPLTTELIRAAILESQNQIVFVNDRLNQSLCEEEDE